MRWKTFKRWLYRDYRYIVEAESKGLWHIKTDIRVAHFVNGAMIGLLSGFIAARLVRYIL